MPETLAHGHRILYMHHSATDDETLQRIPRSIARHFPQGLRKSNPPGPPARLQGHPGEPLLYLGSSLTIAVAPAPQTPAVILRGATLWVDPGLSPTMRRYAIHQWFMHAAYRYLQWRVRVWWQRFYLHQSAWPTPFPVCVGRFRHIYGEVHHGRVFFDYRLCHAPSWVIDSVVSHEVAHVYDFLTAPKTRQAEHGPSFYRAWTTGNPRGLQRADWLNTHRRVWTAFFAWEPWFVDPRHHRTRLAPYAAWRLSQACQRWSSHGPWSSRSPGYSALPVPPRSLGSIKERSDEHPP